MCSSYTAVLLCDCQLGDQCHVVDVPHCVNVLLLEAVNIVIWEETKFALVEATSTIVADVSQRMFVLSVSHHVDVSWEQLATHVTCTVTVTWKDISLM